VTLPGNPTFLRVFIALPFARLKELRDFALPKKEAARIVRATCLVHHYAWEQGPTTIQVHGLAPFAFT
jgi:hypothetical protein